jgi:hypothetical protein
MEEYSRGHFAPMEENREEPVLRGMSPAATITKCAPDIVNRLKRIRGRGERTVA